MKWLLATMTIALHFHSSGPSMNTNETVYSMNLIVVIVRQPFLSIRPLLLILCSPFLHIINDDAGDTRPNTLDPDTESEDEIDTGRPLTEQQFESSTYWFTFRQLEHQANACAICLLDFNENNRISVLGCHHNYHHECVKRWLTTRNANCPTCLESARAIELSNIQMAPTNPRVVSPTPPLNSLTFRPTRTRMKAKRVVLEHQVAAQTIAKMITRESRYMAN